MKVLVFSHHLELGGTQTNAVELAASVRDRFGYDVTLLATPGPAVALVEERGLRYLPAPTARNHPSFGIMRALEKAVRREEPDVLHVWDWAQCFDAYFLHVTRKLPMLCTVMSMTVPEFLPRSVPTTFGTEELVERARTLRSGRVDLLEPPVDVDHNRPGAVDVQEFRQRYRLKDDVPTVVVVSRLVGWLKQESIVRAIEAMRPLAPQMPVQLVIVGEGDAYADIRRLADQVNRDVGSEVVILTGGLADPRPAYAAADIALAMGSSALRAAAFAKPVIVVGEAGFSEILGPSTAEVFLWQGFYGLGDGDRSPVRLVDQLAQLLTDATLRHELGGFARQMVVDRFGLAPAADRLEAIYRRIAAEDVSRPVLVREGLRTAGWRLGSKVLPPSVRGWMAPLKRAG